MRRPSFETPADLGETRDRLAPQDEVRVLGGIPGPHAEEAPKGAVSKHGQKYLLQGRRRTLTALRAQSLIGTT